MNVGSGLQPLWVGFALLGRAEVRAGLGSDPGGVALRLRGPWYFCSCASAERRESGRRSAATQRLPPVKLEQSGHFSLALVEDRT